LESNVNDSIREKENDIEIKKRKNKRENERDIEKNLGI
jgi:hypothetical protein